MYSKTVLCCMIKVLCIWKLSSFIYFASSQRDICYSTRLGKRRYIFSFSERLWSVDQNASFNPQLSPTSDTFTESQLVNRVDEPPSSLELREFATIPSSSVSNETIVSTLPHLVPILRDRPYLPRLSSSFHPLSKYPSWPVVPCARKSFTCRRWTRPTFFFI